MAKKTKRQRLIAKLDEVFSIYIRLRDADKNGNVTCFTCGKKEYWKGKGMQCGHFMSRKHLATRWDETNCQVQCVGCNVYKYGEQYKFSVKIDSKYGSGTAEQLHQKTRETVKLDLIDLEMLINTYKEKIDSLNN